MTCEKNYKMITTINTYVFRALDAYPYDLEDAIEALEMALAYDESNVTALCLMGRVHSEMLREYEVGIEYFEKVLAEDPHNLNVQEHYITALLWNDDVNKALEFIEYAMKIKGADIANLYLNKALCYEHKEEYEEAMKLLKIAPKYAFNNEFGNYCNEVNDRMKKKNFLASKEPKEEKETKNEEQKPTKNKRFGFLF